MKKEKDLLPSTVTYILNFGEQHPEFERAYKQNVIEHPEQYPQLKCIQCGEMFLRDENNNTLCTNCISQYPL